MNRVLALLSLSVLINYIDRSNLSIAAPLLKDELGLSPAQLGVLLSAFFYTYGLMQIPAGWLVDRFDVKWVFAAGFFLWSAATASTAALHGFAALIVIRIVLGLGESVAFPSYSKILGTHFGESRRGGANAALMAGLALGPALGMLLGGAAVARVGWRPFFLVLGLGCMIWLVPWLAWMPRSPHVEESSSGPRAGILDILQRRSAWGSCLGQFCINYALYLLVTWLPFYLVRGRNLSLDQMGRMGGAVFFLSSASAIVSGKLADRWIATGSSTSLVRKSLLGFGSMGLGICMAGCGIVSDRVYPWLLLPAGLFLGVTGSNSWAVAQTLAGPGLAGRWTGVQNFIGNFAGAVAPALTGYLLGRTGKFYWPFAIAGIVSCIGAISWVVVVGPIEPVTWPRQADSSPRDAAAIAAADTAQS